MEDGLFDIVIMHNLGKVNLLVNLPRVYRGTHLTHPNCISSVSYTHLDVYKRQVGGWAACRAAGTFSTRYGKIEDMVVSLGAVLPNGTVIRGRNLPRTATGPRVDYLFLGSEGTLGVITEITLRIWPYPEKRICSSYAFESIERALEAIRRLIRAGARPAVVRLYDSAETAHHFPDCEAAAGRAILILLFEGNAGIIAAEDQVAAGLAREEGGVAAGPEPVERWLETRFDVGIASKL